MSTSNVGPFILAGVTRTRSVDADSREALVSEAGRSEGKKDLLPVAPAVTHRVHGDEDGRKSGKGGSERRGNTRGNVAPSVPASKKGTSAHAETTMSAPSRLEKSVDDAQGASASASVSGTLAPSTMESELGRRGRDITGDAVMRPHHSQVRPRVKQSERAPISEEPRRPGDDTLAPEPESPIQQAMTVDRARGEAYTATQEGDRPTGEGECPPGAMADQSERSPNANSGSPLQDAPEPSPNLPDLFKFRFPTMAAESDSEPPAKLAGTTGHCEKSRAAPPKKGPTPTPQQVSPVVTRKVRPTLLSPVGRSRLASATPTPVSPSWAHVGGAGDGRRLRKGTEEEADGDDFIDFFEVIVHGVLESCESPEFGNLFCRTYLVKGNDWTIAEPTSGDRHTTAEVITQLSDVAQSPIPLFSFNCPFEFHLRSTNVSGWPQIAVSLHTLTGGGGGPATPDEIRNPPSGVRTFSLFPFFRSHGSGGTSSQSKDPGAAPSSTQKSSSSHGGGKDQCVGYARCRVPVRSGRFTYRLPIMQMVHSTEKYKWAGFITGTRAELRDPAFLCTGEDRVVLSATPLSGFVTITFDVVVNGMKLCGFDCP